MRILYVEDNPANLFLVQRVARMGNHEVINYTEGQIALDNFLHDNPDLVLMDVQLPGNMTGLDVVKKLREAGHKTPIIAVTAYAMIGDRERCLQVGCNAYIAKPLPVGELVDMIKKYEALAAAAPAATPATAPIPIVTSTPTAATTPIAAPASKAETPAPAEAKPVVEKAAAVIAPVNSPLPKADVKPGGEVGKALDTTEPEKPVGMTVSAASGQNTPSTLSSNHQ